MYHVRRTLLFFVVVCAASSLRAHPPELRPSPHSWIPRHLIVKDAIYSATAVIDDATLTGSHIRDLTGGGTIELHKHPPEISADDIVSPTELPRLTDDRGPGWWAADSEVFSVSLAYPARHLDRITVQGYQWPLVVDGDHVSYDYSDMDSIAVIGFTLRRDSALCGKSIRPNRVEWAYQSVDYNPELRRELGFAPLMCEPPEACLNGVMQLGGY